MDNSSAHTSTCGGNACPYLALFDQEKKCLSQLAIMNEAYPIRVEQYFMLPGRSREECYNPTVDACLRLFKKYNYERFYMIVDYEEISGWFSSNLYIYPVECYHANDFPYDAKKLQKAEPLIGFEATAKRHRNTIQSHFFSASLYSRNTHAMDDFRNMYPNVTIFSKTSLVMLI